MIKIRIILIVIAVNAFLLAGSVDGPFVVWVNLSHAPQDVDNQVRDYLNSGDNLCWNSAAIMFMRSKPEGFSSNLVKSAIYKHNKNALLQIQKMLTKPYNEAPQGFDGLIIFDDAHGPTFFSITRGKRRIKKEHINPSEGITLEIAMCLVMPEIARKP